MPASSNILFQLTSPSLWACCISFHSVGGGHESWEPTFPPHTAVAATPRQSQPKHSFNVCFVFKNLTIVPLKGMHGGWESENINYSKHLTYNCL